MSKKAEKSEAADTPVLEEIGAEEPRPPARPRKTLAGKLAEIMSEIPTIPKSGRNKFHGYDYATEADIVEAVRKPMAARGVMMLTSIEAPIDWSEIQRKNGTQKLATIRVKFTFLDGDSDERHEFYGYGQGMDDGDKAIYKALTGAEKYALLKTFLIPTGDDPEADDDEGRYAPQGQRRAPVTQAARESRAPEGKRVTAEQPASPSPAATPPDPEAVKKRARIKAVLERAMKLGTKQAELPALIQTILGEAKPSNTWTEFDLVKVEEAIASAERDVGDKVAF